MLVAYLIVCPIWLIATTLLVFVGHVHVHEMVYQRRKYAWAQAKVRMYEEIFSAARHVHSHRFEMSGAGMSFGDQLLNYETLAHMIMMDQEQRGMLVVAMDHAQLWEIEHPPPVAPTWLRGRRLWLPPT